MPLTHLNINTLTQMHSHMHTYSLDFPLAVVGLILYTDCIDPYIGGEQPVNKLKEISADAVIFMSLSAVKRR